MVGIDPPFQNIIGKMVGGPIGIFFEPLKQNINQHIYTTYFWTPKPWNMRKMAGPQKKFRMKWKLYVTRCIKWKPFRMAPRRCLWCFYRVFGDAEIWHDPKSSGLYFLMRSLKLGIFRYINLSSNQLFTKVSMTVPWILWNLLPEDFRVFRTTCLYMLSSADKTSD